LAESVSQFSVGRPLLGNGGRGPGGRCGGRVVLLGPFLCFEKGGPVRDWGTSPAGRRGGPKTGAWEQRGAAIVGWGTKGGNTQTTGVMAGTQGGRGGGGRGPGPLGTLSGYSFATLGAGAFTGGAQKKKNGAHSRTKKTCQTTKNKKKKQHHRPNGRAFHPRNSGFQKRDPGGATPNGPPT